MGALDIVILFAYLALMVGLGFYAKRRQKNVEDYFVAGRRMGPFTISCMWLASWIGGAAIVGTSARIYEYGVTGIWYILAMSIGFLLFGLFMAQRVKQLGDRHNHLTYPDFIEQHYDNRTRTVAMISTVLAYTAYTAGQFAASAAILQVLLGWDYGAALLLSGAIVILYTAVGGYLAVSYTDRVQVALVLIGVVAIGVPVAISHAGSWSDMRAVLPASYYDLGAQGWGKIAALVVSMVLSFFVAMDSFSRSYSARDSAAARTGALLSHWPRPASRAGRRLAGTRVRGPLPGPCFGRRHPHQVRARGLSRRAERPDGDRHPVRHDVGRVHLRDHGVGELHARHPSALHPARHFPPGHAAARHARIGGRRSRGHADSLEDA